MRFSIASALVVVTTVILVGCPKEADGPPGPTPPAEAGVDSSIPPPPKSLAERIRNRLANCKQISNGLFKTDEDQTTPAAIPICSFGDVVFWQADMDVDCDGKVSKECNLQTDAAFQPQTSATASNGEYLDAATLPYVVIPQPSARFDHVAAGIPLGAVVMIVYGEKIEYGVFADTGPASIIGEASYAMAKRLGIDPDPSTGGSSETNILYVAFKGKIAVPTKLEDHAEAVKLGAARFKAAFPDL